MILSFTPKPVKQCLALCKNDEETYYELQFYNMNTFRRDHINKFEGTYMKFDLIEQDLKGENFALAYQDNGI